MAVSPELIRMVRRLDEYELRRLLILVRGLLMHVDGPPDESELGTPPTLTYRQEAVRCGKSTCTSCPHGPYWYAYWREDGRRRKRYIGRQLPGEPLEPVRVGEPDHVGGTGQLEQPAGLEEPGDEESRKHLDVERRP